MKAKMFHLRHLSSSCILLLLLFVISLSLMAQHVDGQSCSSHDDCFITQYCTSGGTCTGCSSCMSSSDSITNDCPSNCNCQNHQDDCGFGNFCATIRKQDFETGDTITDNFCRECTQCGGTSDTFDGGDCPEYCFCESSSVSECGAENFYCYNDRDATNIPDGVCRSCSTERCINAYLADTNLTCPDVCPNEIECTSHGDCPTDEYCSLDFQCRSCYYDSGIEAACWTPNRIYEQPGSTSTENMLIAPYISIDNACPESCCDWGLDVDFDVNPSLYWTIGPCDIAKSKIGVGWFGPNIRDVKEFSAERFRDSSNKCGLQRYNFQDNKFPPSVTEVDCSNMEINICTISSSTIAIWYESETGEVEYLLSPKTVTLDRTDESCNFKEFLDFLNILLIVIVVVVVLAISCIVYCCCCRNRRRRPQQQQGEQQQQEPEQLKDDKPQEGEECVAPTVY